MIKPSNAGVSRETNDAVIGLGWPIVPVASAQPVGWQELEKREQP